MDDSQKPDQSTLSLSSIGQKADKGGILMRLFQAAERINASAIHMMLGETPYFRVPGCFASLKGDGLGDGDIEAIINQMLLHSTNPDVPRVPATEVLINTSGVKMYIEQGEESKLEDVIDSGEDGMRNFNMSLQELYKNEFIDRGTAIRAPLHPERLRTLLGFEGGIKTRD